MTVKELIERLKDCDPDAIVIADDWSNPPVVASGLSERKVYWAEGGVGELDRGGWHWRPAKEFTGVVWTEVPAVILSSE